MCMQAHDSDVNVISWNRLVAYMLASGSDDGGLKIWDLRSFTSVSEPRHVQAPTTLSGRPTIVMGAALPHMHGRWYSQLL
jgi:WD40 repeat protein